MAIESPLILVVDDDIDFQELTRHVLEKVGYRVLCCSDSDEALRQCERSKPALIITDLMMASLDSGFSLSRRIRDDLGATDTPIILVTAVGSQKGFDFRPRTAEDLAAMRVDAYFDKPVAPKTLLAKVKELLTLRE